MPVAPHTLKVPAALAINEAVRSDLVEFGSALLTAQNIRQFRAGEATPRYGFTSLGTLLSDGSTPTAGYKLFADKATTVRICDGTAQVYDPASGTWKSLGRVPECSLATVDLPSMGLASTLEDQEFCNGYMAVSWRVTSATTYAYVAIVNATTWATVRPPEQLASSASMGPVLVGHYGNTLVAVIGDVTGSTIKGWTLDTTSATTINAGWTALGTPLANDYVGSVSAGGLAVTSLTDRVALFYRNSSVGTNRATLIGFSAAGAMVTTTVNTSSVTPNAVDVAGSIADTLWLAWSETTNCIVMGVNGTTLATTATRVLLLAAAGSPTILGIAPSATPGNGRLIVNDNGLVVLARSFYSAAGTTVPVGSGVTIQNAWAAGRPFAYGGRYYVPAYSGKNANGQKVCFLVDCNSDIPTLRPLANVAPSLASLSLFAKGKTIPGVVANKLYFGLNITRSGVADASSLAEFDFAASSRWQPAAFGKSTFLSGGILSYTDGTRVAEVGFLIRPLYNGASLAAGSLTGTYRYVFCYEEVDSDGNWCISGLSDPSAAVSPAAQNVTVTVTPLSISARLGSNAQSTSVRVAVYRTATGGVAPYYRLGTIVNDTSLQQLSYVDSTLDATLTANAKLYSQPGVLGTSQDRRAPPGLAFIVSYNGMLVGASGSDIWFSGQGVSGEGTWFNPIFQGPVPGIGDITALAVMDGTLFIFKRGEVYGMVGSPPSDNGATGGLGTPVRLACDVGCIESRSICTSAAGVFFQSDRGIELLTRAQTVMWIGQKIQQTLAAYPVVTSATVQPTTSGDYVLIELAASQAAGQVTGLGRTLVFDLSTNEWQSVDRRATFNGIVDSPSQSAAVVYTGAAVGWRYAWLSIAGTVHYEDQTRYTDADGSFITAVVETGWYMAAQNEQRVYRGTIRYQRYSPAGLTVETAYDEGGYTTDPQGLAAWSEDDTSRQTFVEWSPAPRGETLKFRITITAPATLGTGPGIGLITESLDLAAEQGPTQGTLRGDPALRR